VKNTKLVLQREIYWMRPRYRYHLRSADGEPYRHPFRDIGLHTGLFRYEQNYPAAGFKDITIHWYVTDNGSVIFENSGPLGNHFQVPSFLDVAHEQCQFSGPIEDRCPYWCMVNTTAEAYAIFRALRYAHEPYFKDSWYYSAQLLTLTATEEGTSPGKMGIPLDEDENISEF